MVTYMVVTDDNYELPIFVCDTELQLRDFLGGSPSATLACRFLRSKTGVIRSRGNGVKYFRMNSVTGEIFIGKLPRKAYIKSQKERGRRFNDSKRQTD